MMSSTMLDQGVSPQSPPSDVKNVDEEYARFWTSKFRFKSSRRKLHHDEGYGGSSDHEDRRRRNEHLRRKRRKTSSSPNDTRHPDTSSENYLDPDAAFRESLFDAMADDEGAQFWEGVYGQPVPQIPNTKTTQTGELEAMTADEYAAHIRAEMYKRTPEYLFEESRRKEQARRKQAEAEYFFQKIDESLRRGKERKEQAKRSAEQAKRSAEWDKRSSEWGRKWKEYEISWGVLAERKRSGSINIPWPIWQGKMEDISKDAIEQFFLNGPTSGNPTGADLLRTLKAERVRWHPDKVQQKLGEQRYSKIQMQAVTAVFQIIDRMFTELRDKKR